MQVIGKNLYKKRQNKIVFIPYEFEDDLKKMSNVGTFAKNVYCCIEHVDRFKKFKKIKKIFTKDMFKDKDSSLNKSEIENSKNNVKTYLVLKEINNLIKFDLNLKTLFLSMKIEKFDILEFLLSILGKFSIDTDNLILINISHFMKEINFCKKYANQDYLNTLINYFESFNFLELIIKNQTKKNIVNIDVTNFTILISLFNICNSIFSFSSHKIDTDYELTFKLVQYALRIIEQIININNDLHTISEFNLHLKNEIVVLSTLIYFLNNLYYSTFLNVDLNISINNFIIFNFEKISLYIMKSKDIILVKNGLIFFQEVFQNIYNTKMEFLSIGDNNLFLTESKYYFEKIENNLKDLFIDSFEFDLILKVIGKSKETIKQLECKFQIANN